MSGAKHGALSAAWSTTPVERAGVLIDAADYYRAFYRAALAAQHSILIAGWQFDSDVELVRGEDAKAADAPVTLREFLDYLCERNPQLEIYLLAWDFHLVFAAEREWMQTLRFDWSTNERLHFLFDSRHAEGGSHHQKFVVIDGHMSFLGGIDLCDHRWDESTHETTHPLRTSRGEPHRAFHDVQLYVEGAAPAAAMGRLFARRWQNAGGAEFEPRAKPDRVADVAAIENLVPLETRTVSLSRTDPLGLPDGDGACREIERQYIAAIADAQRLLYIETQYLSSHVIGEALEARLRTGGPPLEIVVILNLQGESFKEQTALGLAQAEIIGRLRDVASSSVHRLGIFYTLSADAVEGQPTYIHSKLMLIDDQALILGSANLTNRSMSLDTELNAAVATERSALGHDDPLSQSLAELRRRLLEDHTGLSDLTELDNLVARLDDIATRPAGRTARLRRHPSPLPDERALLAIVDPQRLPFDPDFREDAKQAGTFWASLKALFGADTSKAGLPDGS